MVEAFKEVYAQAAGAATFTVHVGFAAPGRRASCRSET